MTVQVSAIEADSADTVVILDDVGLSRCIHPILMRAVVATPRLNRFFAADDRNFFVGIHLCHRSGTAVETEDDNDSQNEQDGESRDAVLVTTHG